jgi:hypothetical protein
MDNKINREMIGRRRKLLGTAYELFYEEPAHLMRGEGVWLFDPNGVQVSSAVLRLSTADG